VSRGWFKRGLVVAGVGVLAIAATLGVSYAQDGARGPQGSGPRAERMQAFAQAVASNLGVTTDQLHQAVQAARAQVGAESGGSGHPGAFGHHRWARAARMGMQARQAGLDAAAQALGITPDQLRQELPGKSLTDVAHAHNVDPSVVANALKAVADQRVDQLMTRTVPERGPRG